MTTPLIRPDLPLSAVAAIAERAAAAGWPDVIPMAGGEPRFPCPPGLLDSLHAASPDVLTKYSPFKGTADFLEAARDKLNEVNHLDVAPDEIIAVPGGAQALFSTLSILVHGTRKKVIITDPCWEHYPRIAIAAGAEVVRVRTTRHSAHDTIDLDDLDRLIDHDTAAVLLNTPLNPTGSVLSEDELDRVGWLCESRGARMVVDEEYETFVYGAHRHTTARAARRSAISLFSLSKSFALTGIRMGYITADAPTIDALKRFGLFTYMYSSSPALVLGTAALRTDLATYLAGVRSEYEEKTARLAKTLDAIPGIECAMPEGGVYVFPRIADASGESLAERIVSEQHVLCVPGEAAGSSGRGHVRFFVGLADDVAATAAGRIRTLLGVAEHPGP
ncbi:pyridoxal phosphate-dependent aminotransferase [Amycolatopsis keratiniphila]|uniref:Aminotransferase n=1 Tax=Amycolatopsis keratiniphila TaxID=129921 RepID=R4SWG9_9PSEU|nr:pyridoxal phosphate-dependent aminotransferase [Amycolatopsis keratiniphila]AGM04481.1 aspartate aminotransferase [Amycolatopsis keratiniphila]